MLLRFCPLPPGEPRAGTNRARMAERYERYREQVVRSFYEDHFSRFDRQIVLVDLLGALNAGPDHFADTQESLALILKSFRYGGSGLLAPPVRAADRPAPVRGQQGRPCGAEPAPGAQAAPGADDPAGGQGARATRGSPPR